MSAVHEIAAKGFGAQAATYDRVRPSYPPDAVRWLTQSLRIRPGHRVVDLAAGTGKLTVLLAGAGADLIAVEPVTAMRDVLRAHLPGVATVAGTAEALPFASGSIDAVTVAQAFHWFDAARAMAELARVIPVGGRLGVIWNSREPGVDWVDRIWSVMDRVELRAPWRSHGAGGAADASAGWTGQNLPSATAGWSPWTKANFFHVQRATHQDVVDRMLSVSRVAALAPAGQEAVLAEIRAILSEHPDTRDQPIVSIGYRVAAWYTERGAPT
jgi:SAM-dependent methyltransferase